MATFTQIRVQSPVITRTILFNDLKSVVYIECLLVWKPVHSSPSLSRVSPPEAFPSHSSFNSNSLSAWLFFSSPHTHLFACHFPFMSITVTLHFLSSSSVTANPFSNLPHDSLYPLLFFHCYTFYYLFKDIMLLTGFVVFVIFLFTPSFVMPPPFVLFFLSFPHTWTSLDLTVFYLLRFFFFHGLFLQHFFIQLILFLCFVQFFLGLSFYTWHPRCDWVTWICLFTLQPVACSDIFFFFAGRGAGVQWKTLLHVEPLALWALKRTKILKGTCT